MLLAVRHDQVVGRVAGDRRPPAQRSPRRQRGGLRILRGEGLRRARAPCCTAWRRGRGSRGRALLRGPLNPSLNESAGLLIDGFDTDPMLMMPHNPPEYAEYLEAAGYRKVKDLYAWLYDLGREIEPAIVTLAARLQTKHQIIVRPLELSRVRAGDRALARDLLRRLGAQLGLRAADPGRIPPAGDRAPADFRSAMRRVLPKSTAGRSPARSPFPTSIRR